MTQQLYIGKNRIFATSPKQQRPLKRAYWLPKLSATHWNLLWNQGQNYYQNSNETMGAPTKLSET